MSPSGTSCPSSRWLSSAPFSARGSSRCGRGALRLPGWLAAGGRAPGIRAQVDGALTRADPSGMAEDTPHEKPEARIGETLQGKWHVERLLGVGGMGAVYAATHRNGRKAAIKILHARFAADRDVRKRFMREGYVANKIDHPGAVAILDDDVLPDGSPFLVMELLDGESLSVRLR